MPQSARRVLELVSICYAVVELESPDAVFLVREKMELGGTQGLL